MDWIVKNGGEPHDKQEGMYLLEARRTSLRKLWRILAVLGLFYVLSDSVSPLSAQGPRPRITGISQIAFFSHDYEKSRAYYGSFLGLEELTSLDTPSSKPRGLFRINERQYIEVIPEREALTDRLSHISLETDDIEALRRYLSSKGISVPPHAHRDKLGILSFSVTDPEGHHVEMLQYSPNALILHAKGKPTGYKPISNRMAHVGLIVVNLPSEYKFYTDILGFRETYRNGVTSTVLSWINLRVPDGDDYIEFMLYKDPPDSAHALSAHHLCLQVLDVPSSVADLEARPYFHEYAHPMQVRLGVNRKRQINLFDPDGTRLELMESRTIDGKEVPSSNAPSP